MHTHTPAAPTPRVRASKKAGTGLALRVRWGSHTVAACVLSPRTPRHEVSPHGDTVVARGKLVFEWTGQGAQVRFSEGVRGAVWRNSEAMLTLSDVVAQGLAVERDDGWSLQLGRMDSVRFEVGSLTVEAVPTKPVSRILGSIDDALDYRWLNILLGTVMVASFFIMTMTFQEPQEELAPPAMVGKWVHTAPTPPPPQPMVKPERVTAERMTHAPVEHRPSAAPAAKPHAQPIDVRQLFAGNGKQGVFGGAGVGADLQRALGAMVGAGPGGEGIGLRGLGGLGDPGGPIGIGAIGHAPRGPIGDPVLHQGPRAEIPKFREGVTDLCDAAGCLDKELIRKVIRDHLGQVRFCYERSLRSQPNLEGRAVVHFHIAASGLVDAANVTVGMGDVELENCLVSRVRQWVFPKSRAMGGVGITYPFIFKRGE